MKNKDNAIEKVRLIEEYCNTYKCWPKQSEKNKKTANGTTSNQLAWWLHSSGYNKGEFRYSQLLDLDGINLKEKLDTLYKQYKIIHKFDKEYIIKIVDEIEEYCNTYKCWPKQKEIGQKVKSGLNSSQLISWLYTSGYMTNRFKYEEIVDENGIKVKDRLDTLVKEYNYINKQSSELKIKMVEELEEYCIIYNEWPKQEKCNNKTSSGVTSVNLVTWLYTSGYMTNNFKYTEIVDKNGVSLKTRIDVLANKYHNIIKISKLDMVKEIEEYCRTYNKWPKENDYFNKTKKGYSASQLRSWLDSSGYSIGKFKYANILDEKGITLKERLDILKQECNYVSRQSSESKIKMVEEIEEYCRTYNEWPCKTNDERKTSSGLTSHQLMVWLINSGYNKNQFKYSDIIDKNGVNIKEKLDNLYNDYYYLNKYIIEFVDLLEEYCKTYNEWPKVAKTKNKTKNGTSSAVLARILINSGYASGNFKYLSVVDKNGISIKERIDKLYETYGNTIEEENNIDWLDLLESYCKLYQKFPKAYDKTNNKIGQKIYGWLYSSGYLSGDFKYSCVIDEDNKSIKEKIDRLFLIFADEKQIERQEKSFSILNLNNAKVSKILGINLYYYVIKLKLSLENNNLDEYNYYKTLVSNMLINKKIALSVEELIESFSLSLSERRELYTLFTKKYYDKKDQVLTILYRLLMEYEFAFTSRKSEKIKCFRRKK